MPYVEKEIEKIYWTIEEAADIVGVETSHIRFWQGEIGFKVKRIGTRQDRRFKRVDLEMLSCVKTLCGHFHLATVKRIFESGRVSEALEFVEKLK
jgi:DNA-binding transcriptional MerR regulator